MTHAKLPDAEDIQKLYRLIHELCELGSDAYGWRAHLYSVIMPMIDAHVGAAYVMRFPVDDSDIWPRMPLAMHVSAAENWQKFVEMGDLTSHPANNGVMARLGTDFTCTRQDLVDDETWNASDFRASVANPAGWDQMLVSQTMISPPGYVNGIDFMRAAGKPAFSRREVNIVHYLHGELARLWRRPNPMDINMLAKRQREVLDGIRRGEPRKTIADKMGVTSNTVHEYEKALYQRSAVKSRGELLARLAKHVQPNLLP